MKTLPKTLIVNYTATGSVVADVNVEKFAIDAVIRTKLSDFGAVIDVANELVIRALMGLVASKRIGDIKILIAEDGDIMSELDADGRQDGAYVPRVSQSERFGDMILDGVTKDHFANGVQQ